MSVAPEYVVKVKAWPAYVLVAAAVVAVPLYGFVLPWLLLQSSSPTLHVLLVPVGLGGELQVVAMIWVARLTLALVRHPPRLSAAGLWLWLPATSAYVHLPWERVVAVRTATKGLGLGLFVYVHDPESLVGGSAKARRRLRRDMRRLDGAPFAYPLVTRGDRLDRIDAAVRYFSAGRLGLAEGVPAGV